MFLDIFDPPPRVLVVDDETTIAHAIRLILEDKGCEVIVAHNGEDGLAVSAGKNIEVALLDIVLPGINGITVLAELKRRTPDIQVIIMTSHASVDTAIQAIRQGAYDYIHKPFDDIEDVWNRVGRAVETQRLTLQNRQLLERHERMNTKFSDAVMRLSSLIEIGQTLGGFHTLTELSDHLSGLVAEQMNVECLSILLLDGSSTLRLSGWRGFDLAGRNVSIAMGAGITGSVAETGTAWVMGEVGTSRHASDDFMGRPIAVSIPIHSAQRPLGVMNLSARRSGESFAEEDVRYLIGLAGQASIAIERLLEAESLRSQLRTLPGDRKAA